MDKIEIDDDNCVYLDSDLEQDSYPSSEQEQDQDLNLESVKFMNNQNPLSEIGPSILLNQRSRSIDSFVKDSKDNIECVTSSPCVESIRFIGQKQGPNQGCSDKVQLGYSDSIRYGSYLKRRTFN